MVTVHPVNNYATNYTTGCTNAIAGTDTYYIKMDTVAQVSVKQCQFIIQGVDSFLEQ